MVLTLRWDACGAQFRVEGRPILLAPAPYSLKRWLDVEAMVTRASLESPAESEASADNPWTDMDEEVGDTQYSPGSVATAGSPPGITSVWLSPDLFDGIDWPEAPARWHQLEAHLMLAEAAGGSEEQRKLVARRHVMLHWCEGFLVRYILAAWADNSRCPWPVE